MTATTVNGKLISPAAGNPASAQVTITLVDYNDTPVVGFNTVDQTEVLATDTIRPTSAGLWTVQLVPNATIQLTDGTLQTAYRVVESGAGSTFTYWIAVAASSNPVWAGSIRTTLVGNAGSTTPNGMSVAGALTVGGKTTLNGAMQIPTGAANGDVLTSDASGNATWKPAPNTPLDTNAAHLQPDGVAAAGNQGLAADSKHAHPAPPWEFWITNPAYGGGAKGTLDCVIDGAMNASAVLTSASGKFASTDVGKAIAVKGALTSGQSSLVTTIASYQSPTQVTLNAAATVANGTNLQVVWGDDDTAAIQATIDAAMAYGGNPFGIPTKVVSPVAPGGLGYMVAGALKNADTAGNTLYNGQLTTGLHSDRYPGKTLEFWTPIYAGSTRHWNQDYPSFTGCTWFSTGVFSSQSAQSTSISTNGNPAVLCGPTGAHGYGVAGANPQFNNVTVILTNMSIMNAYSNSGWTYSPFNFHGMARAHLRSSAFGTNGVVQYYAGAGGSGGNTDFSSPASFSGGASLGGLLPAAGNNADNVVEDCVWQGGYTYGPVLTEHTTCKGINRALGNWIGVGVAGLYGDGGNGAGSLHAIDLGQWCIEECSYHLGVWGAGSGGIGPYVRGTLDTEGVVQIRGVPDVAANLQALSGELYLAGSPSTPAFDFPTNLHLIKQTQTRGPVASPSYTLGTAQINTFWRDATVTISGGTVTAVKVSALAGGASAPTMTTIPGLTSGTFRVPSGCWWEIDGTVAPTSMQWVLD